MLDYRKPIQEMYTTMMNKMTTVCDIEKEEVENELFENKVDNEPIPQTLNGIKIHPKYTIEKQLLKYQILHPEAIPCGEMKNMSVYLTEDVYTIHTAVKWVELGKQVKASGIYLI